MLTSPREARIAGCAVVLLAGGVAMNVALFQGSPRERRAQQMPAGMTTALPGKAGAVEPRRPSGPMTLTLASLIDADPSAAQEITQSSTRTPVLASTPAPKPAATLLPSRMVGIARSIDRLLVAQPEAPPPNRQQDVVRQVQSELAALGYAPGPADGDAGMLTRAAILAFEHDRGLPATAEATDGLLLALRMPAGNRRTVAGANWRSPSRAAAGMVRAVQQNLIAAGLLIGAASGQFDAPTAAAIRAFETANNLTPTGRISAPLVTKLRRIGTPPARVAASGQ
jgi:peptidoglycan hydrolase-like protein with peptidoglycan-binding domain